MGYTANNPRELKDIILRRLGAPVVNVEVTEDQVFDCISRAIELFTEYHPDGLNRAFAVVTLTAEQARSGVITFDKPYYAVTKILRAGSTFFTLDGTATYDWFSDFVRGLAGAGSDGSCQSYYPNGIIGGGIDVYSQLMSYQNELLDQLQPVQDYWYNGMNQTIRVFGNLYEGDMIIFECWAKTSLLVDQTVVPANPMSGGFVPGNASATDLWDDPAAKVRTATAGPTDMFSEQNVYNVRWVKDFATALVKEINGTILKKHQGMQLPGGVTIDGLSIYQEARQEIETLRDELLALEEPLGIIWG